MRQALSESISYSRIVSYWRWLAAASPWPVKELESNSNTRLIILNHEAVHTQYIRQNAEMNQVTGF